MLASLFFLVRLLCAWAVAVVVAAFVWAGLFYGMNSGPGWLFGLLAMLLMLSALIAGITHLRKVWLIAGRLDWGTLASRQRRQIEIPLDTREAFALLDAAVRELPRVEEVESTLDSLQVRAKVRRIDP